MKFLFNWLFDNFIDLKPENHIIIYNRLELISRENYTQSINHLLMLNYSYISRGLIPTDNKAKVNEFKKWRLFICGRSHFLPYGLGSGNEFKLSDFVASAFVHSAISLALTFITHCCIYLTNILWGFCMYLNDGLHKNKAQIIDVLVLGWRCMTFNSIFLFYCY